MDRPHSAPLSPNAVDMTSCSRPPAPMYLIYLLFAGGLLPGASAVFFFFFFSPAYYSMLHGVHIIAPLSLSVNEEGIESGSGPVSSVPEVSHHHRGCCYATDGCRRRPWVSGNKNHNNKKQPWQPMTSLSVHVQNAAANSLFASAFLCPCPPFPC